MRQYRGSLDAAGVLLFNLSSAMAVIAANKQVFKQGFAFPATLTCIHYLVSLLGLEVLRVRGWFSVTTISASGRILFSSLVVSWTLCNAFSNVSLEKNSVGFYTLMKILVTPIVVVVDRCLYAKQPTATQALLLATACAGITMATVTDVQATPRGAIVAILSVATATLQKVTNGHLQEQEGIDSLQLMYACFPYMCCLSALMIPLLDPPGMLEQLLYLDQQAVLLVLVSAAFAFCASWSATMIFGRLGALAHVLLGQLKTTSVLLVGAVFFDAQPTTVGVLGSMLAVCSIGGYAVSKVLCKGSKSSERDTNAEGLPLTRPEH
jgi:solute carrier family 35 protein E3